jgi:hypothetical protein
MMAHKMAKGKWRERGRGEEGRRGRGEEEKMPIAKLTLISPSLFPSSSFF